MFQSEVIEQGNMQVLQIYNEFGTKASFVPERGGILASLTLSGMPVFYLDQDSLQNFNQNIRGGNPVLFPVCGPLEEGQYYLDGKAYRMKQHGFARNLPWQVLETETSPDMARIKLQLKSDPGTRQQFPFDFDLICVYEITSASVRIKQCCRNLSSRAMPLYGGYHPYFLLPELDIQDLYIPSKEYYDIKTGLVETFNGSLNLKSQAETNLVFTDLTDSRASFQRKDGTRVTVQFDNNFRYVVLWALREKEFICIEPWMGSNYDMNRGRATVLGPGEELKAEVSYSVQ